MFEDLSGGEERGVSPVLGIVILVGITVILASVVGAFAFKLQGSMTGSAPEVSLSVEQGTWYSVPTGDNRAYVKTVTFTHTNGEPIDTDNLAVRVNGRQAYNITKEADDYGDDGDAELLPFEDEDGNMKETFALGDTITVIHSQHSDGSAFTTDPSTKLENRRRYSNNDNGKPPENSNLIPDGMGTGDSNDVALHTGDAIQIIYTSGSGRGTLLYEYTVV